MRSSCHQFPYTTGQELDGHHPGDRRDGPPPLRPFDGFCLVSSDSDFTRLAARIREQAIDLFGFGEQKTPEAFRQACTRLIYTENLLPEARPTARMRPRRQSRFSPPTRRPRSSRRSSPRWKAKTGGSALAQVGRRLANLASDFDQRTYGFRNLSDLIRKTNAFDIDLAQGRLHAHSDQACGRTTCEKARRPQTSGIINAARGRDLRPSRLEYRTV